ncbi:MAG TPA: FAD-dependent oxidoreductase, partial [Candidatus Binatia bacterium]|nr:FAD-dependent oxidoreductase [Candidatus Binatia bacterium]
AGPATAYHLSRRGGAKILLLEQESIPGFHSSGRNAAMMRQCVPDPDLAKLTRDGATFLRNLPDDWPEPVQFKQNGSLLLGSGRGWEKLKNDAATGRNLGIDVVEWTPQQAKQHVSVLKNAEFEGAIWCGSDGIIDIHALLSGYLKSAISKGARVRYGSRVQSLRAINGNFEIVTDDETIRANVVVNGSGAWANVIGKMAGARELPLRPCRRHLFISPPTDWVDPSWPFVWDVTHDIYFRPEGEGLLLCACDQQELAPGDPPVDESVKELLAEKIDRFMPALSQISINKYWAGFRTLTPDGRFVIGWDGQVKNFFWVAGLGGHGMTTSASVGELAADLLLGGSNKKSVPFSPERFDH